MLPLEAATPTVKVVALAGLSQVIRLQSQTAALIVVERVSASPTWLGYDGKVVLKTSPRADPVTKESEIGLATSS